MKFSGVFLFSMLFSSAFAGAAPTVGGGNWPAVSSVATPRRVVTESVFHYSFRFDFALAENFRAVAVEGRFEGSGSSIPAAGLSTFPLSSGELLYQGHFRAAADSLAGDYVFGGCVRVLEVRTGETRCLALPARVIEVVD